MGLILTILGTVLVLSVFSKTLGVVEEYIVEKFSSATSTRRWFTIWVFVYFIWAGAHLKYIGHSASDIDLVVFTGLFSAVPFWVENSLKRGQAEFNKLLLQLINQNNAKEDALYALVEKLVNSLEVNDKCITNDGPTSQTESEISKSE